MKRVFVMLLALVVLAACTPIESPEANTGEPVQETIRCWDDSVVESLDECPPEPQEDSESETMTEGVADQSDDIDYRPGEGIFTSDEEPTAGVSAELSEMRARADEKTSNGYSYTYVEIQDGLPVDSVFQTARITRRADQIAIEFPDDVQYEGYTINKILAENDASQGIAYCVDCRDRVEETVSIPELVTPFEYLDNLENSEFLGEQSIDSRNSFRISGTYQGEEVTLYADTFSGLPLRIDYDERRIDFKDIALGSSASLFEE